MGSAAHAGGELDDFLGLASATLGGSLAAFLVLAVVIALLSSEIFAEWFVENIVMPFYALSFLLAGAMAFAAVVGALLH